MKKKHLKIFVTGGEGFIGSYLIDKLIRLGHRVASFDARINFAGNPEYYRTCMRLRQKLLRKPTKEYRGDIRNKSTLRRAMRNFSPDVVVHLAGLPIARVPKAYEDEMVPINLYGTMNVLQVFEESKAKRIVYTSSSFVYGHFKQTPQSEDFVLFPENLYGATKAAGEFFVRLSKKEWVIVRPTSVYGFTDCSNRVTQILLDAAFMQKPAWVVRGETLDFSYIDDVVDGFIKCILQPKAARGTFNISRGEARSGAEFALILQKHFPGFRCEIKEPTGQQVYRGPQDISKARTFLRFNPKVDIEEGIKKILKMAEKYEFYN
jgi:nucleoside-diphosphate-sugar epimerase